jgi:hypothetical protein
MTMSDVAQGRIELIAQIAAMAPTGMRFAHGHSPVHVQGLTALGRKCFICAATISATAAKAG